LRIADLGPDSWFQILLTIKRGEHPSRDNLAAALRRGESVPPARKYIAGLLDGSVSVIARGRPKTWAGPDRYSDLISEVNLQRSRLRSEGERCPMRKALQVVADRHHISAETAEKYYRRGWRQIKRAADRLSGTGTEMDPFVSSTKAEST
jgi:hypothetical protein